MARKPKQAKAQPMQTDRVSKQALSQAKSATKQPKKSQGSKKRGQTSQSTDPTAETSFTQANGTLAVSSDAPAGLLGHGNASKPSDATGQVGAAEYISLEIGSDPAPQSRKRKGGARLISNRPNKTPKTSNIGVRASNVATEGTVKPPTEAPSGLSMSNGPSTVRTTPALSKKTQNRLDRIERQAKKAAKLVPGSTGLVPESTIVSTTTVPQPSNLSNGAVDLLLKALQQVETRFTALASDYIKMAAQFEVLRKEQHDQTTEITRLTKSLWDEKLRAA